ncbi:hypothetical protein KIF59_10015 [Enterobacter cloacae subsp. cloacae]|nr:hypothetical protein [Enterobacter cloacae subsp. cloacae]
MFSFSYLRHRRGLSRWFKHTLKIRHTYENRNVVAVSGAVLKDLSKRWLNLRRTAVIHNPFDIPEIQHLAGASLRCGKVLHRRVGRFRETQKRAIACRRSR